MSSLASPEDRSVGVVLMLIDLVNEFDFPGAPALLRNTKKVLPNLVRLKARFVRRRLPVIYANDNRGQWRSDFREQVARSAEPGHPASSLMAALHPTSDDYFVLKPKQSAFMGTPLDLLLRHLGARTLVLGGIATDGCIACTAMDAHLRELNVYVPRDCVAASTSLRTRSSLRQLADTFGCDTRPSAALDLGKLRRRTV